MEISINAASMDSTMTEHSRLTINNKLKEEVIRKQDGNSYHPLEQEAPGPRTLSRCSFIQCATAILRTSRIVGSAMFGAGIASGICSHMMNESDVRPNQPVFVGIGAFLYVASLVPAITTHTCNEAKEYLKLAGQDAIVPVLTAFSVYFLQAHKGI